MVTVKWQKAGSQFVPCFCLFPTWPTARHGSRKRNVLPKRRAATELYGVSIQKAVLLIYIFSFVFCKHLSKIAIDAGLILVFHF
jgi:hypothetical protein